MPMEITVVIVLQPITTTTIDRDRIRQALARAGLWRTAELVDIRIILGRLEDIVAATAPPGARPRSRPDLIVHDPASLAAEGG